MMEFNSLFVSVPKEVRKALELGQITQKEVDSLYDEQMEIKCPYCGKYYQARRLAFIPMLGCYKYSDCECVKERFEREEAEKKQRELEASLLRKKQTLVEWGIPPKYFNTPFNIDLGVSSKNAKYFDLGDQELSMKNLLLFGNCGIGKTFFAWRLIENYYHAGKIAIYIKMKELLHLFKNGSDDKSFKSINSVQNIKDFVKNANCVVIDEVDDCIENLSVLNDLIGYCYDYEVRIVLIGNCNTSDIKNAISPKAYDRLTDGNNGVVLPLKSLSEQGSLRKIKN